MQKQPLDLIKQTDELRSFRKSFILSPIQWDKLNLSIKIKWQIVKFNANNINLIPEVRGIYCFMIRREHEYLPTHGYITYIGITGDKNNRTLRTRYKDYVREKTRPKRVKIHELLNKWEDDLFFYFWEVSDKSIALGAIESSLLFSLIPPLNEKDFPGEFGKIVKEAWRN